MLIGARNRIIINLDDDDDDDEFVGRLQGISLNPQSRDDSQSPGDAQSKTTRNLSETQIAARLCSVYLLLWGIVVFYCRGPQSQGHRLVTVHGLLGTGRTVGGESLASE